MSNSLTHTLPYPIKNAKFSLPLSWKAADGTPTDPTAPDTEFSTNGGVSFADCANEADTGGANGGGYITLTGAETNAGMVHVSAEGTGILPTLLILSPRVLAVVTSGTLSAGSASGGTLQANAIPSYDITDCFIMTTGGTGGGGTGGANNQ